MKIAQAIGTLGKSQAFVTAMAHMFAAFSILSYLTYQHIPLWASTLPLLALVLYKEYIFDLHYESGETYISSTEDFLEYLGGIILAWILYHV